MRHDDASERRAAIDAGAWYQEPASSCLRAGSGGAHARHLRRTRDGRPTRWAGELHLMEAIRRSQELGAERFRLLAAYGHPVLMELVLAAIADADPATAAATGAAFTKITGQDTESDNRAILAPADGSEPDEVEAEFLDEVMFPSPELARAHWEKEKTALSAAPRICKGFDVSKGLDREAFATLDMESRWEIFLRSAYGGTGRR